MQLDWLQCPIDTTNADLQTLGNLFDAHAAIAQQLHRSADCFIQLAWTPNLHTLRSGSLSTIKNELWDEHSLKAKDR